MSADRPEKLIDSLKKHDLTYTLLSDHRMDAARAFGIAFQVDEAGLAQFEKYGIDLEEASGETHHVLPVPSVFLIDGTGVVRFRHFDPDYTKRLETDQLMAAARKLARP